MNISEKGILDTLDISEVGVVDGLVAYYPLNGNARDYSGNRFHGTISGVIETNGISGSAYYFDGTDDYISLNYGAGINPSPLTLLAWVKTNNAADGRMFLSSGQSPDSNARLYLSTYSGRWDMGIYNRGWGAGTVQATNEWTFIAVTMDGSIAKMRANGIETRTIEYTQYNLNQNIHLGRHGTSSAYSWNGSIQDVRIYNRVLTDEEIHIMYKLKQPEMGMQASEAGKIYLSGRIKEV